jgi:hypothetical protein
MGLVKIDEEMHENLRVYSRAMSRSINAQAEHWMRLGMLAELYPFLSYQDLTRKLLELENWDIKELVSERNTDQKRS